MDTETALGAIRTLVRKVVLDFAVDYDLEIRTDRAAGEIRIKTPRGNYLEDVDEIVVRVAAEQAA